MILLNRKEWIWSGLVALSVVCLIVPALAQAGGGSYSLRGVVLDAEGTPVPGAKVIAVLSDNRRMVSDVEGNPLGGLNVITLLHEKKVAARREVGTDENGRWAIRLIRKGLWNLQAYSEDRMSVVADIMVRMSKSDIELVLTRSDTSYLIEAKIAIYENRWEKAIETLELFKTCFPESKQLDNALYWLAFCRRKFGESIQERMERKIHFAEAVEDLNCLIAGFPESEWRDDAMILRIEIALRLVQMGQAQYESLIREGLEIREPEEINVRLAALDSYRHIDEEKAIQLLMEIARTYEDPAVRKKRVYILGSSGGKYLLSFLRKIAEEDPDESVRRAASIWLKR